jgi:hypothetical protein
MLVVYMLLTRPPKHTILQDARVIGVCDFEETEPELRGAYGVLPFIFSEYLLTHKYKLQIMCQLKHVYVLVGQKSSERIIGSSESTWHSLLSRKLNRLVDESGYVPLAWILIKEYPSFVGIEWIDVLVEHQNLGIKLIREISAKFNKCCIPLAVNHSFKYWVKYFEQVLNVYSSEQLFEKLNDMGHPVERIRGYKDLITALDLEKKNKEPLQVIF